MRLLFDLEGQSLEVELDRWDPQASLGDLISSAMGPHIGVDGALFVDAQPAQADTPLSDLTILEGSRISRLSTEVPLGLPGWSVGVAGGMRSTTMLPIPRGRKLVAGRAPNADLLIESASASWEHCTIELEDTGVRLRDSGSTNGTVVNGVKVDEEGVFFDGPGTAVVGGAVLVIRPHLEEVPAPKPGSLPNLTQAGTAPFNRPPRPGVLPSQDPIMPPEKKDVPPASKFSYITVLAPLAMAGAMVMMIGDMRFALFAALSPVMAVGMWFEQKHRRAKNLKEEDERFAKALDDFRDEAQKFAALETLARYESIPDPATVLRRPAIPTTQLWQRRSDSVDFLALHAGTGDIPWKPEIDQKAGSRFGEEVRTALNETRLRSAPVKVDLTDAGVVGIVGERDGALALARSLVTQAAVHAGPADLTIAVYFDKGRENEWQWTSWLPHTRMTGTSNGARWISNSRETSSAMLRNLRESIEELPTPAVLAVLDSEVLTEGRDAPARKLLGHGRSVPGVSRAPGQRHSIASGIVIAQSQEQLPAACTTIIEVGADASATLIQPEDRTRVDDIIIAGIDLDSARACAMNVAHFDDPELVVPGATLPPLVRLPELLGFNVPSAHDIAQLWDDPSGFSTPIGTSESGVLSLDLVKDGPHGLVGGTTGSGKSEFLRSFVAGLAARNDPTRLNFILIDFKGGAAFKACERLPHTIGTISNLDEQLADRALRALEAEMQRRQRLFAAAGEGIDNLPAYMATNPAEPMPRLLLVIDEFAMLAKDFPDVLSSLVSVAAVGRTLGVHMILATQRPAGVVNDDILANTNLRVALRVQSRDDSINVIAVPAAANISRSQMGRAYVKLGQDDITAVQTALVTGPAHQESTIAIETRELDQFGVPQAAKKAAVSDIDSNDLDLLIDAVVEANSDKGYGPPRKVWPEAFDARVDLEPFGRSIVKESEADIPLTGGLSADIVQVALVDEPDMQRQVRSGWDMSEGNLLLMGVTGSGTTTTMKSIALSLAEHFDPHDLDLLILDLGARELAPLQRLPHTVAYVGTEAGAKEQQARFLRHLKTELDNRRASTGHVRKAVVLIDGLATLRDEFQDYEGQLLLDILHRAYADGPNMGLSFVVSTTRAKAIPSAMDEVTTQKWLYRLADAYDYSALGVKPKEIPAAVPGRAVNPATKLQMHIGTAAQGQESAIDLIVEKWAGASDKGEVIRKLPTELSVSELGVTPRLSGQPWLLPVGIAEADFTPAFLEVYEGEHVLVAGPARSGKSTMLLAFSEMLEGLKSEVPDLKVWAICDRRSPLAQGTFDKLAVGPEQVAALAASVRMEKGPLFLLIDDAERFEDSDQTINSLVTSSIPGLCIIAAGRSADLRGLYSHWTKTLRKSRLGVLLQPDTDYDGELAGVNLPRKAPVDLTQGRGYLCVGGQVALVQTVSPSSRAVSDA